MTLSRVLEKSASGSFAVRDTATASACLGMQPISSRLLSRRPGRWGLFPHSHYHLI